MAPTKAEVNKAVKMLQAELERDADKIAELIGTNKGDTNMAAPKKTAAKKVVKKSAAKKGTKKTRKPARKFTEATRSFAAAVTGEAIERALAADSLGVKRSSAQELSGKRTGMVARIKLDDGTGITVTVAVR